MRNRSRYICYYDLDILSRSGDIRGQSRTLQKIDRNFACFWPLKFFWRGPRNFPSLLGDSSQMSIMWQSFAAIGRGTSEMWLSKKRKRKRKKTSRVKHKPVRNGGSGRPKKLASMRGYFCQEPCDSDRHFPGPASSVAPFAGVDSCSLHHCPRAGLLRKSVTYPPHSLQQLSCNTASDSRFRSSHYASIDTAMSVINAIIIIIIVIDYVSP